MASGQNQTKSSDQGNYSNWTGWFILRHSIPVNDIDRIRRADPSLWATFTMDELQDIIQLIASGDSESQLLNANIQDTAFYYNEFDSDWDVDSKFCVELLTYRA